MIDRQDPRREDAVVPFVYPQVNPEEGDADGLGLLAMVLGSAGIFLKMKYVSWAALVLSLMTLFNKKSSDGSNTGFSSLSFALMGIIMTYMNVFLQPPPQN